MISNKENKKPVILSADDDKMIHKIIINLFSNFAEVATVSNTVEAEDFMRKNNPDIVLMDDIMPGGMTGLKFLEYVKKDKELSNIPIIMVTASNKKSEVMRGLSAGAVDYITKPFKPEILLEAVQKILNHHVPKIHLIIDNKNLEEELMDSFTHLKCDTYKSSINDFNNNIFESDFVILSCDNYNQVIDKIIKRKNEDKDKKLNVIILSDNDFVNQESYIFSLSSKVNSYEIVKKVGKLLKSSQK